MEATQNENGNELLQFGYPENIIQESNIIKVVGVGGGGSNAVANMYKEGIQDVTYLIINTDRKALESSPVPNRLQIGDGLGAGAVPDKAEQDALDSEEAIRSALSDGTKMVFITAGMGGGTGTGASPVVARIARELGILTIGIVTIPFDFEGIRKIQMALHGVSNIRKYVDALLVVNNTRLAEIYPDLNFFNAFKKADDTLTIAARSISDIINITGYVNLDFADVKRTLEDSGVALISTGQASGENRLAEAIKNAITSPLLQDNEIKNAKRLLFEVCFSEQNPMTMSESKELNEFTGSMNPDIDVIWGAMVDNSLEDDIRIIVLAAGFDMDSTTGRITVPATPTAPREADPVDSSAPVSESTVAPEAVAPVAQAPYSMGETPVQMGGAAPVNPQPAPFVGQQPVLNPGYMNQQPPMATPQSPVAPQQPVVPQQPAAAPAYYGQQPQAPAYSAPQQPVAPQPFMQQPVMPQQPVAPQPVYAPQPQGQVFVAPQTPVVPQQPAAPQQPVAAQPVYHQQPQAPVYSAPQQPVGTQPIYGQPVAPQPVKPQQPAPVPPTAEPAAPEATQIEVNPTSDPMQGLEEIIKYYGKERAISMRMDQIRKNYYMLDQDDLTNDQLVRLLERMPAYNRSYEQLCELKNTAKEKAPSDNENLNNGYIF